MKTTKQLKLLTEEVYWLSQNENFLSKVLELREKYSVPLEGFKEQEDFNKWVEGISVEQQIEIEDEISILAKRCRASQSKHKVDFRKLLGTFFYTNYPDQFDRYRFQDKRLSSSYPTVIIKNLETHVKVELLLDFDTSLEQIKEVIEMYGEKIKLQQEKVAKVGKLKDSPNFTMNVEIWEMRKRGLKPKGIEKELRSSYKKTTGDIYKLLERIKQRIDNSFQ